jgi:hypothetical protein
MLAPYGAVPANINVHEGVRSARADEELVHRSVEALAPAARALVPDIREELGQDEPTYERDE